MFASQVSKGPLSLIIIDEISLEGLEGITFDGLWKYISFRLELPLPLLQNLQNQIWNFILSVHPNFQFYELPQPREKLKIFKRGDYIDQDSGLPMLPEECPFTKYKFVPIEDGNIRGSCEYYKERRLIDIKDVKDLNLNDIMDKWGDKFVIVASQKLRNKALISETVAIPKDLSNIQYCTLETIGRARYNGEVTNGRHNLQRLFKDAATMFYIRNKLLDAKLIVKQPYNERLTARYGSGFLLTLPRFYREFRTRPMVIMETLYTTIKSKENGMILVQEVKDIFTGEYRTTFKKFRYMSLFKKSFDYIRVPYRTYYPDADEMEYLKRDCDEERELNVVKLKNPNATLEEVLVLDETKEESNGGIEFLDVKNSYIDMPMLDQVYDMIEKAGPVGITQTSLVKDLAMTKYIVRTMLRKLTGFGVITTYLKDVGRQRTTIYVTVAQSRECSNIRPEESESFQKLVDIAEVKPIEDIPPEKLETAKPFTVKTEQSNKTESDDDNEDDEENIEIIIKDFQYPLPGDQLNLSRLTKRQIDRINFIIAMINENLLLECSTIYKWIKEKEIKQGFKDQLCKKSLYRHITWLKSKKIINAYEISLKLREYGKCYKYITHPKLTPDSTAFQDELKVCKTLLCSNIYDKQYRIEAATQSQLRREKKDKERRKLHKLTQDKVLRVPKFLRAKYYHEFWLYLAYQQDRSSEVIEVNDRIFESWKVSEPEMDIEDIKKNLPPLYSENISYLMFINPLPEYKEPKGWIYFEDALIRMPLSLLAKTHKFNKSAPLLEKYINHPIRQHFLVDHLPVAIQEYLGQLRLSLCALDESLKLLGHMGLIQVGEKKYKDPRKVWLYINRNAILLDTKPSDPGYDKISTNKTYEELKYNFENQIDIKNYWDDLNSICFDTRLGHKSFRPAGNKMKLREPMELPQPVGFYEAISNDVGYLPGDKLGAAGLNSVLCPHLRLNWSWVIKLKSASQPLSAGKKVKLPGLTTKLSAAIKERRENKKISKVVLIHGRKVTLKRRGGVKEKVAKSRIRCEYDSVDKEALKLMQSLRVSWSPKEDRTLKLCRSVLLYLNDSTVSKHISCHIMRDILHWSLQSLNKTSRACQRRLVFVVRQKKDFPDSAEWAHELRQNKYINHMYGPNFIHDLRRIYPIDSQFILALKIHFIKLVHYLIKLTSNADTTLDKEVILPDTINQFYQFYKETSSKVSFFFDPVEAEDIKIFTILGLIHSSVCCAKDKTMYNIQLFEIYKSYKEELLSKAVKIARSQQLMVNAKIKTQQKGKLLPITGSHYSLSGKYRQQLFLQIPYTILEQALTSFDNFIFATFEKNDETFEFISANSGLCFFVAEIIQLKNMLINIKIPSRILTVDPNQTNLSSVSEKILDHFRQMYENAPKTEYTKYFDDKYKTSGSRQPKVKFNVINESYKLEFNPYNILSKLSDNYIHFFCTLNHLNKVIDLNFAKLSDDKYCPFDCVLNKPNYIEVVEEIIKEKYDLIELLTKVTTYENITQDNVLVTLANLLQIFEKLQEFLRKRTKLLDKKDMGKISIRAQTVDVVDLAKKLAEYTDEVAVDFGEYEQTLNKDDKIIRAHDFFVVNLPKITINYLENSPDETTQYKGIDVPAEMFPGKADKNVIIEKIMREFIWSFTKIKAEEVTADMVAENFSTTEQMFTLRVLEYIKKNDHGVYASELIEQFQDEIMLVKSVTILKKHSLILRVGVENFCYVYKDNVEPWTIRTYHIKRLERESTRPSETEGEPSAKAPKLDSADNGPPSKRQRREKPGSDDVVKDIIKQRESIIMRPAPWIRVNGSLNRRVFDKWIGSILVECIAMNGQKVTQLFERFSYLYPVHILFLLEILRDLDCISLKCIKTNKSFNIFSTYDLPVEREATEFSRHEDVFIIAKPNAVMNLAHFIGEKKYKTDFV